MNTKGMMERCKEEKKTKQIAANKPYVNEEKCICEWKNAIILYLTQRNNMKVKCIK